MGVSYCMQLLGVRTTPSLCFQTPDYMLLPFFFSVVFIYCGNNIKSQCVCVCCGRGCVSSCSSAKVYFPTKGRVKA